MDSSVYVMDVMDVMDSSVMCCVKKGIHILFTF
jgi:hypothetical protein